MQLVFHEPYHSCLSRTCRSSFTAIRNVGWRISIKFRSNYLDLVRCSCIHKLNGFILSVQNLPRFQQHERIVSQQQTMMTQFCSRALNASNLSVNASEIVKGTTPIAVDFTLVSRSIWDYKKMSIQFPRLRVAQRYYINLPLLWLTVLILSMAHQRRFSFQRVETIQNLNLPKEQTYNVMVESHQGNLPAPSFEIRR